jgi:cellulose synthase/poly-beta-1,6-N-acetylglucosamine synthase-like glycosyltransferase
LVDIEIPYENERSKHYRFFEILPGAISWFLLALPLILSFINVSVAVFFIVGYLLIYVARSAGVDIRALQGYRRMQDYQRLDWNRLLTELEEGTVDKDITIERPKWHIENTEQHQNNANIFRKPSEIIHIAMIATYNESVEVLEPTVLSVLESDYDIKKIILVIAYEERGGSNTEELAQKLVKKYGDKFMYAVAIKHPVDMPGEMIGKGANITFAGREIEKYLVRQNINPLDVIVTTLDADNKPHKKYFSALTYVYCICPDPVHVSFQPVPVYTNNIWDAPAPMRVVATGNTVWNIVLTLRPHMLRNFSSHAQSMQTLIDTNFWSVRTIVEDGHQFWRTYFRYDGKHVVYPIYIPVYQDAVLASTYWKTLKAQFIQLRRWTWGASDIAYVVDKGFYHKNTVPKKDLCIKLLRLFESHITWAVAPPLLLFSGFVPALFHPESYAANVLPHIISHIQEIALIGALATLFICFKTLPPKPKRYKANRSVFMVLQWVLMPVTALAYSSTAALYSQTRLMFGKYIGKFDVTEKKVITDTKKAT